MLKFRVPLHLTKENPSLVPLFCPKGTDTGTVTDLDGKYELPANKGTLVFSSIGYATKKLKSTDNQLSMVLSEESTLLESVVVIGYGTQRKKDLTSAVVVVDEKVIKERPMVSAAEALQGTAAGVQVVATFRQTRWWYFC